MFDLLEFGSKILLGIDNWIFNGCQRFSDKFQRLSGKTNFILAKAVLSFSILSCLIGFIGLLSIAPDWISVVIPALFGILVIFLEIRKVEKAILKSFQKNSDSTELPKKIMEMRQDFVFERLLLFCTFLTYYMLIGMAIFAEKNFPPILFLSLIYLLSLSVSLYFASCQTIPPVKGRLWQTVKGWFTVRKLVPAPIKVKN